MKFEQLWKGVILIVFSAAILSEVIGTFVPENRPPLLLRALNIVYSVTATTGNFTFFTGPQSWQGEFDDIYATVQTQGGPLHDRYAKLVDEDPFQRMANVRINVEAAKSSVQKLESLSHELALNLFKKFPDSADIEIEFVTTRIRKFGEIARPTETEFFRRRFEKADFSVH
jgi:hypothetical protein